MTTIAIDKPIAAISDIGDVYVQKEKKKEIQVDFRLKVGVRNIILESDSLSVRSLDFLLLFLYQNRVPFFLLFTILSNKN
jgi:hypothetical protein